MGGNPNLKVSGIYNGLVEKNANGILDWTHELRLIEARLTIPLHWRSPRRIFVNSLSDLFHESVPVEFIKKVFSIMNEANWHQYQILTKRSERLAQLEDQFNWSESIWQGVSVESQAYQYRIDHLKQISAKIRFLSLEPLLGPLPDLDLMGIDWVIVGGESGVSPRPMLESWVQNILEQCQQQGVPFFFKQWGGKNKKINGRTLNGRTYDDLPKKFSSDNSEVAKIKN